MKLARPQLPVPLRPLLKSAGPTATAALGPVLYALLQAVSLIIITRFGGAEDTGLFLLAQSIATPIALLVGLRLREQIATMKDTTFTLQYVRRQLRLSAPVAFVGSVIWFLATEPASALVGSTILLANLSQGHVWTVQGGLIRNERFQLASGFDAMLGVLSVVSFGVGFGIGGIGWGSLFLALTWTAFAFGSSVVWAEGSWGGNVPTSLASDLRMGISSMGAVAQISVGRIGTSLFLGQTSLARLGTGSFLIRTTQPLAAGLLKVNAPRLAKARQKGPDVVRHIEQQLQNACGLFVLFATPIFALAGYLVGVPLIRATFGDGVVGEPMLYAVLLGSAPVLYGSMLLTQILVSRQDSAGVLAVTGSATVVTITTIYPLAKLWDEPGAAAAIGLGYLARTLVATAKLRVSRNDLPAISPVSPSGT